MQAIRTKDPVILRQAQANIAQRRAGLKTPIGQSPATFATPGTGLRAAGLRVPGGTPANFWTPSIQAAGRWGDECAKFLTHQWILYKKLKLKLKMKM